MAKWVMANPLAIAKEHRRLAISQWPMGNRQSADRQSAMGNGQWAMGNGQWIEGKMENR
jgi:hypothetical protein